MYLEDSSPSARVRAYDWLAARGRAPQGYEPLGPARERRRALDAALESGGGTVTPAGGASVGVGKSRADTAAAAPASR